MSTAHVGDRDGSSDAVHTALRPHPRTSFPGRFGSVLALQRGAGNAAVAGLLDRRTPVSASTLAPDRVEAVEDHSEDDAPGADQSQLIIADAQESEQKINAAAEEQQGEITTRFGATREGLSALLGETATGIQGFLTARQTEFQTTTAASLASAQELRTSTMQSAGAQIERARTTLDGQAQAATTALETHATTATGRITGGIDSLPLPNLPGVSTLRAGARSLASGAAGVLTSGLARARGLISSAIQSGARLLGTVLSTASDAAGSALTRVTQTVQNAARTVAQALGRTANTVIGGLRAALNSTVVAGLNRTETSLTGNLGKARQKAIEAVHDNRDQHLRALQAGGGDELAEEAKEHNSTIVTTFRERTTGVLGQVFTALAGGATALRTHVGQVVTRVGAAAQAATAPVIAGLRQAADAVGTFMSSLLSDVTTAVAGVIDSVRAAVQHPIDALTSFFSSAATRVGQFFSGLVSRALRGDFSLPSASTLTGNAPLAKGPITKPKPGPITIPGLRTIFLVLVIVGAIVLTYFPSLVAAVATVLAALGITVGPLVLLAIVGLVVIVALILLLLLIYLMYKLVRKRPRKPCKIKTRTLLATPNGAPRTRTTVGVNEQVAMTASGNSTWAASTGTLTPATGKKVIWTAPATGGSATITATPVGGGGPCTVTMTVQAPTHRSLTNPAPRTYTPGLSGSGFVADVTIMPTSVAFSRIQVREETATGVATGYYDTVLGWNGTVHPVGTPLTPDATNGGIVDTVGTNPPGGPTPFSVGTFLWPIPQTYSVSGGGQTPYSTGNHTQNIVGPTGEETTAKEGATTTRTP